MMFVRERYLHEVILLKRRNFLLLNEEVAAALVSSWTSIHRRGSKGEEINNMEGGQRRGSSEFRRANIVYFLSRNGTVEHPHLIRVNHLHSNGVHLRDVKRWLKELRGKDMPDSYAWSYKRLYKNGYVWQDMKDDDLITPISDNEYVLKGSLLQFHSLIDGFSSDKNSKKETEKAVPVSERQVIPEPKSEPETLHIEQAGEVLPEPPQPELDGDSPIKSDNTDRRMAVVMIDPSTKKQEEKDQQRFKRSYSSRASNVLRNILKCRAADTNDSVLMPISGGSGHHRRTSTGGVPRQQQHHQQGCETDNNSRKSQRSTSKSGGSSASYKPLKAPNCSQCGRPFDPEKLHSHMQSCRALKGGRGKGRINTDRVPLRRDSRSEDDFSRDSISGYLT